jgi:hypothetical protein
MNITIIRSKSSPATINFKVPLSKILDDIDNIEDWYIVKIKEKNELYIKLRSYTYSSFLQIKSIIKQHDYHEIEINEFDK